MTPRIIMIEDEQDVARVMERILRKHLRDFTIKVVSTRPFGDQVVGHLLDLKGKKLKADVLVTDINLLGEVGFEIIRRVMMTLPPDLWPKFIAMTGDPDGNFGLNGLIGEYPDVEPHIAAIWEKTSSTDKMVAAIRFVTNTLPPETVG